MKTFVAILWLALLACALGVLGGWFGTWHPALDSLGVGLHYVMIPLVVLTLLFAVLRRWMGAATGLLLTGFGAAILLPLSGDFASRPVGQMTLMQHNLLFVNEASDLDVRITGADVITLQEVRAARQTVANLPANWSAQLCVFAAVGDTAIVTHWPILDAGCMDGGAWLQAQTPDGPVTFVSLHLHWPWPKGQAGHVTRLLPDLRALPRPVIVAGDFNQTPWSAAVARIAEATDTRIVPGLRITLSKFGWLHIPIDHVLVPQDWVGTAQISGSHGSDHQSLTAQIGPLARE